MVEADIQPAIIKMYVRSTMRYSATILITLAGGSGDVG